MPYEIKYDADLECMMCRVFGELQASELPGFAADVIALLDKHNCVRVLNDLRKVDLRLSTMAIYNIPELVAGAGLQPNVKRAIVFRKDAEDYEFFETVSINQGQFVRVFTDFDKALTWLKGNKISGQHLGVYVAIRAETQDKRSAI